MNGPVDQITAVLRANPPVDISGGSDPAGKLFYSDVAFGDGTWDQWAAFVAERVAEALKSDGYTVMRPVTAEEEANNQVVTSLVDRITAVQRQHREEIHEEDVCICGWHWTNGTDWPAHVAERVAEALQLTQQWAVELEISGQRILCEPTPFPPRGELAHDDITYTRWVSGWSAVEGMGEAP